MPDRFIEQDKPQVMYEIAGLDASGIVATVFAALGKDARIDAGLKTSIAAARLA